MIEVKGNLWDYPADVRIITTNGTIKNNGECVMGRGCAAEAKQRHPTIARVLGEHIQANGNHVGWIYGQERGSIIFSYPVKHNWFEKADPILIERSAKELMVAVAPWLKIVMPRPGCGNGRLNWDRDVKPILEPILDDRFHVITF
jgi:hypothetical protein